MIANITVYAVAYLLFHAQAAAHEDALGAMDIGVFRVRRSCCALVCDPAVGAGNTKI